MIANNSFVVLIALIVNLSVINCIFCTFKVTTSGYECFLFNQTIQSDENNTIIIGAHQNGLTDANITHLEARNSSIHDFPTFILNHFENLNHVHLSGVKITNFSRIINNCNKLNFLSLERNEIATLPDEIFKYCGNLKKVYLNGNGIRSIDPNAFVGTNITKLNLRNNNISFLDSNIFAHMPYLEKLMLSDNMIPEILPGTFNVIQRLRIINFSGNKLTSWNSHNLPKLSFLFLHDNQIETIAGDAFSNMLALSFLDLSNNYITKIPTLKGLTQLIWLNLHNNKVKKVDAESFIDSLNITTLKLSCNEIETINFPIEKDRKFLPKIKELNFRQNRLAIIDDFIFPVNVTSIDFSDNKLTHLKAGLIQPMSQLGHLNLENNEIQKIDREFFNDVANIIVYMNNNVCFNGTIEITSTNDRKEKGRILEKCFNHASSSISSIVVLVGSFIFGISFYFLNF